MSYRLRKYRGGMDIIVRVEGHEVINNLRNPYFIAQGIDNSLEAIGRMGYKQAYRLCRVKTGETRDSIFYQVDIRNNTVTLGATAEQAVYNEFGTGFRGASAYQNMGEDITPTFRMDWAGMLPRPFIRPAAMLMRRSINPVVQQQIMQEVRKASLIRRAFGKIKYLASAILGIF